MLKASAKSPPEIGDHRQSTAGEIGQTLRRAREARGEDLAYVSDLLRIRIDYLAALEEALPHFAWIRRRALAFGRWRAKPHRTEHEQALSYAGLQRRADHA